jgi:hypothetical protein
MKNMMKDKPNKFAFFKKIPPCMGFGEAAVNAFR